MLETLSAFLLSPVLCYFVISRVPAGVIRLVLVSPFLYCMAVVPVLARDSSTVAPKLLASTLFLVVSFISGFKLLAWSINRGPLSKPMNFLQFWIMLVCPIYPAIGKPGVDERHDTLSSTIVKHIAVQIVSALLVFYSLPAVALNLGNAISFLLLLNIALDLTLPLVRQLFSEPLAPAFSSPWTAKSYREFWSYRWNRPVSGLLRELVFKPIMEGQLVPKPYAEGKGHPKPQASIPRFVLAQIATFAVSGLMHEWCLWVACNRLVGWHLAFFMLQVPAIYLQELLLSKVPSSLRERKWFQLLQTVWTVGSLLIMAELFWLGNMKCHRIEAEAEIRGILTTLYSPLIDKIDDVPAVRVALESIAPTV